MHKVRFYLYISAKKENITSVVVLQVIKIEKLIRHHLADIDISFDFNLKVIQLFIPPSATAPNNRRFRFLWLRCPLLPFTSFSFRLFSRLRHCFVSLLSERGVPSFVKLTRFRLGFGGLFSLFSPSKSFGLTERKFKQDFVAE